MEMSYPVRLEGHQNERLASECIITDANRKVEEYIPKTCSHLSSSERIISAFLFILNSEDTLAITCWQTIIQ
jgi:hypothetical protein